MPIKSGFRKRRGTSCLAKRLLAFQEGICPISLTAKVLVHIGLAEEMVTIYLKLLSQNLI